MFRLRLCNSEKAVAPDQLLGRLPARVDEAKFRACSAGKLPFAAHEFGKAGRLPLRVRVCRPWRQPRDCHVSKEQLDSKVVFME